MRKLVVILLSVFAFVACSKDEGNYLADITTLHNTWWKEYSISHMYYDENGDLLRQTYNGPGNYAIGGAMSVMYLDENCIREYTDVSTTSNPNYKWYIQESTYVYNPTMKQIKIGEEIYEVKEFSSEKIEISKYKATPNWKDY